MKLINNILELIGATFIIAIALLITLYTQLELIYELGIIGLGTVLAIAMYILSTRYEKRLESELKASADMNVYWLSKKNEAENKVKELKNDFANQVKATDEANKERDEWKNKFKQFSNAYDEPFSEDSQPETQGYICPECGKPMTRMTDKIVFCDNIECTRKQWKRDKLDKGE